MFLDTRPVKYVDKKVDTKKKRKIFRNIFTITNIQGCLDKNKYSQIYFDILAVKKKTSSLALPQACQDDQKVVINEKKMFNDIS